MKTARDKNTDKHGQRKGARFLVSVRVSPCQSVFPQEGSPV